jgi:hypothetical protein
LPLAASAVQNVHPGGRGDELDGLVGLYDRAGQGQYGWHMFLDLNGAEWSCHSFDPIPAEQVPWDSIICRYRKVTPPAGMEKWFAPDFDAAKAGWKTAKAPFGTYNGKIPEGPVSKCSAACVGPVCYGATPVNTLWEKEVLMIRGTYDVPPLKEGHRYRLQVNHAVHVGNGGGFIVYVNGKPLIEQPNGLGRGGGELPNGAFITKDWLNDFKGGKVTLAVMSFIRYNDKYAVKPTERVPQGRLSVHVDEQKLPPMGDDLVRKSATVVPMLSSEWQKGQYAESDEERENAPLFRWNGTFVANPGISGAWKVVGEVAEIAAFNPAKPVKAKRPLFDKLTFEAEARTSEPCLLWSGDHLMDLTRYQALKMELRPIGGTDYLFIETGGFSERQKPGWKSGWLVLTR